MISEGRDSISGFSGYTSQSLFNALAHYLKTPLLHVSSTDNNSAEIRASARAGLDMINGFLIAANQLSFELSPVMPAKIVRSVAEELEELAQSYSCKLEVDFEGRQTPIMTNPGALKLALICLGQSFITAASAASHHKPVVTLALNKTKEGTAAGIFADIENLNSEVLRKGRQLHGYSKMPLAPAFGDNATGVFIADSLLSNMSAPLYATKHNHLRGFAATFLPSKQLSLV